MDKFFSYIGRLTLSELGREANLYSFITLKGCYIASLKECEAKYVKEKRKLIIETCKWYRNHLNDVLQNVQGILKYIRKALITNGYRVKVCRIKAISRVVAGVSESFGKIPFEVGLFFDPILNVPFIPSSTLKGAFRHALLELIFKNYVKKGMSKREAEEKAKTVVEHIFGSEKLSSLVGVTDAYPIKPGISGLLLEPDVITPHYSSVKTELDVKPNPVLFLTIARGIELEFFIYFNKRIHEVSKKFHKAKLGSISDLKVREFRDTRDYIAYAIHDGNLEDAVKKALTRSKRSEVIRLIPWVDRAVLYAFARGIGAKTSIGYSRFEMIEYRTLR